MSVLKIYGRIIEVLPQQVGTNKSGKQWFSQQFVVEEVSGRDGEYTNQVCFTLMNSSLNEKNVPHVFAGNDVTVSFHVSSREWSDREGNRRFSSDLQAYRVESGDTTNQRQEKRENGDFTPVFANSTGAAPAADPKQPTAPVYGNQGVLVGNAYYPNADPSEQPYDKKQATIENDLPF